VSPAALRFVSVTKRFGSFVAVSDLSLEVPAGCIYGILGPNGAGKTTSLRMVNNILAPDQGRVELFGGTPPGTDVARRVGYLPEERGLYPKMRVGELLRFFGELRGLAGTDARRAASRWLARLGLDGWQARRLQELSKGMQQKVQFITAVIHDPELIILDEPWTGLDPINAAVLRDIVLEKKAEGRTILFSTHLMEQAEQLCERVCIIAAGQKVLEGDLAAIKREAQADHLVAITFADSSDADEFAWPPGLVRQWTRRKDAVEVELAPGVAPRDLMGALAAAGIDVRRFVVIEPTLHQIFIERVGRAERRKAAAGADG
jgi:ABC-2 type transport system ATP-binding protein